MKRYITSFTGCLFACGLLASCADFQKAQLALDQNNQDLAIKHLQTLAEHGFPEALIKLGKIAESSPDEQASIALDYYKRAYDLGNDQAAYYIGHYYFKHHQNKNDLALAKQWIIKAAQQGNLAAQLLYAEMLMTGQGIAKDMTSALTIYNKLSQYGYSSATRQLASLYEKGQGVKQNKAKALSLYKQAVKQGSVESELDVARFYVYGNAVETDFDKAESIYLKHAQLGNPKAPYLLGNLYEHQSIIEGKPLLDKAIKWYRYSAEQGYIPAIMKMVDVKLENNPDTIELAVDKLKQLSKQNHGIASYRLGRLINTRRIPGSHEKELEYYKLAYKQGYGLAAYHIAEYYFSNQKDHQDLVKAKQWKKIALRNQSRNARFTQARLFLLGSGWPRDIPKAILLYKDLSDQGMGAASSALAKIYETGLYTTQNYQQALFYLERAAKQGDPYAELEIARFYADGLGVDSNWSKAKNIFLRYARAGYHKAAYLLAENLEKHVLHTDIGSLEQAVYWYQIAAENNIIPAKLKLIDMMLEGQGVPRNIERAKAQLILLSKQGIADASLRLGDIAASTQGKDVAQALHYYQLAFQQGSRKTVSKLATLYQQGYGLKNKANRTNLINAANSGNVDATYLLGVLDTALSKPGRAFAWYKKAARAGHAKAMLEYGLAMFTGNYTKRDKTQGLAYVLTAARLHVGGAVNKSLLLMVAINNAKKIKFANQLSRQLKNKGELIQQETVVSP